MRLHRVDGGRPGNDQIAIAEATTSAMTCRRSVIGERWIEANKGLRDIFVHRRAGGASDHSRLGPDWRDRSIRHFSVEDEQIAMFAIKIVFPQAKTHRNGEENDAQIF